MRRREAQGTRDGSLRRAGATPFVHGAGMPDPGGHAT
jgi:hypothetical protein